MNHVLQFNKAHIQDHLSTITTDWLLTDLELVSLTECHAVFSTSSEFKQDIIERYLNHYLSDAINELYSYDVTIEIILRQCTHVDQAIENESIEFHEMTDRMRSRLFDIESQILDTRAGLKNLLHKIDAESGIADRDE